MVKVIRPELTGQQREERIKALKDALLVWAKEVQNEGSRSDCGTAVHRRADSTVSRFHVGAVTLER